MSYLDMHVFSHMIARKTEVAVILPERYAREGAWPVLWLLHGGSGNYMDWMRFSSIERYAEQYGMAVVMPSAEMSFYADVNTGRFLSYITEELPAILREMMPLSADWEDNIVAGLSMGGHGAYKVALSHPQQYAAMASLSAGNVIDLRFPPNDRMDKNHLLAFGTKDLASLQGSEHDVKHLARLAREKGGRLPVIYAVCGTEDGGYGVAKDTLDTMTQLGFETQWHEGAGKHDWTFWDTWIQHFLAWYSAYRTERLART